MPPPPAAPSERPLFQYAALPCKQKLVSTPPPTCPQRSLHRPPCELPADMLCTLRCAAPCRFHEYYEDIVKHYHLQLRDAQGVSSGWPTLDELYKVRGKKGGDFFVRAWPAAQHSTAQQNTARFRAAGHCAAQCSFCPPALQLQAAAVLPLAARPARYSSSLAPPLPPALRRGKKRAGLRSLP